LSCISATFWAGLINYILGLGHKRLIEAAFLLLPLSAIVTFSMHSGGGDSGNAFLTYGGIWYHGLKPNPASYLISSFYMGVMLITVLTGFIKLPKLDPGQRIYFLLSIIFVFLMIIDILVFYQIIFFPYTWGAGFMLFAVTSSIRLQYRSVALSRQLEKAHIALQEHSQQAVNMHRLSSMGLIIRGVVHDLKNFFQITQMFSEVGLTATENHKDLEVKNAFKQIEKSSDKAAAYLKQMLEMVSESSSIKTEAVRLKPLIEMITKICGVGMQKSPVELIIDISPDATLHTDRRILQQILLNLTFNALKVLSETGGETRRLRYQYIRSETADILAIEDNGPGLPEKQAEALNSDDQGLHLMSKGIGLQLVKDGCHKLGAQLKHDPGEGGMGTRFSIVFPFSTSIME
jgi:signal transduction histidine kinase